MREELEDMDAGGKGSLTLLLKLAALLAVLRNMENSPEFLSPEARQILEDASQYAKRMTLVRYIV
ncbi:hypothetical protein [Candidatus Hecatella orcuttiae]|jgi:division protein CdvB (Snf7/Vps24/ESCRT-III family)|uniref:hypothetical protein n=1 Tax=Candidatus Hecatella orcuttiae TaxID=1935119 RepID=UPI0028680EB1|nr:hypothetical protein [Candidatus Hecatella orcuttiae]